MTKKTHVALSVRQKKKRRLDIICYFLLILPLIAISLPLITAFGNSLKDGALIFVEKGIFPMHPTLENYSYVITKFDFLTYFKSSVIISSTSTVGCVFVGCLTGYAISRFKGRGFSVFKIMTYVLQLIPIGLLFLPLYLVVNKLGLYNTYGSVIIVYMAQNLCLTTWIMKGFFDSIPYELEESAYLDGCGSFRSFSRIVMPLAGPGIACCAILVFMNTYNELALATLFLKSKEIKPLTLGLQSFSQQFTAADSLGYIFAGAMLTTIPAIIVVFFAQKYIVAGLSGAGSLKG